MGLFGDKILISWELFLGLGDYFNAVLGITFKNLDKYGFFSTPPEHLNNGFSFRVFHRDNYCLIITINKYII